MMRKICFLFCLFLFLPLGVMAQRLYFPQAGEKIFVTVTPQSFLLGFNMGAEVSLNQKSSLVTETSMHHNFFPTNLALSAGYKYYFRGEVGKGVYVRTKVVGGLFFDETVVADAPYYLGGGFGVGGMMPIQDNNQWYGFIDAGLKLAVPLGHRSHSTIRDSDAGMAYYVFLSPASIPEFSIGIAFRF